MRRSVLALLTLLLASASFAQGSPYTVTNGHDHGPGSLRNAIVIAAAGDTILFADNVTVVALTTGELDITKNLTVKGPGAKQLTIRRSLASGTPQFRVFNIENATMTISGVTIANGFTDQAGAGIHVGDGGGLVVAACAITHNKGASGPAINSALNTNVTITACTISDNESIGGYTGGGLSNLGTMTISRSTVAHNISSGGAGAILNLGRLTITNSTIAGNSTTAGSTGGIYAVGGDSTTTRFVKVRNTIIAKNTDTYGEPDFSGRLTSLGYDLVGDTRGTEIVGDATGNQLNIDPRLAALQDNGGPTMTRALISGSPAIDRGYAGITVKDQRGYKRPVDFTNVPNADGGDGSDIGAFEVQPSSNPAAVGDDADPIGDAYTAGLE